MPLVFKEWEINCILSSCTIKQQNKLNKDFLTVNVYYIASHLMKRKEGREKKKRQ